MNNRQYFIILACMGLLSFTVIYNQNKALEIVKAEQLANAQKTNILLGYMKSFSDYIVDNNLKNKLTYQLQKKDTLIGQGYFDELNKKIAENQKKKTIIGRVESWMAGVKNWGKK